MNRIPDGDHEAQELRTETVTLTEGDVASTRDVQLDEAVLKRIREVQRAQVERARAAKLPPATP